jgi:3-methyl-2-oxobutanoate hydroxymethyltransferase
MKTIQDFYSYKEKKQKISMITCYDYTMARLISQTDVDTILVGDSLGMVMNGYETTIPVTLEEMIYHVKSVRRGIGDRFVIGDLPFLSYHTSKADAVLAGGKILQAGANAVKLEGGEFFAEIVYTLTQSSIPVCGHLGMTPQSFHMFGGFKLQGKEESAAEKMISDAMILQEAGAFAVVLELVPESLAQKIAEKLTIPVIGIGAGRYCDGQVLVVNDVLGMDERFNLKMAKKYDNLSQSIRTAVQSYHDEVAQGIFPAKENVVKE